MQNIQIVMAPHRRPFLLFPCMSLQAKRVIIMTGTMLSMVIIGLVMSFFGFIQPILYDIYNHKNSKQNQFSMFFEYFVSFWMISFHNCVFNILFLLFLFRENILLRCLSCYCYILFWVWLASLAHQNRNFHWVFSMLSLLLHISSQVFVFLQPILLWLFSLLYGLLSVLISLLSFILPKTFLNEIVKQFFENNSSFFM